MRPFCSVADSKRPEGYSRWVEENRDEVAVRWVGGKLRAYSTICPHMGGKVTCQDDQLFCPWHGASFDAETGKCLNVQLKALRMYEADVRGEEIWVNLEAHRADLR